MLPLVVLFFLFWYLQRLTRKEIGLAWGRVQDYGLAVIYPVLVLLLVGVAAWASGQTSSGAIDWGSTLLNVAGMILVTAIGAIVTEEGIFRGWLWATLKRAGVRQLGVLVWTSVVFAVWHISTALLPTAFHPALIQVPVYILNAAVIGFNWALMRQRSGSIVVTSISHGVWNGLVYGLFGTGTTIGILGVHNTAVFGPEIGLLGLALNVAFAAVLWLAIGRRAAATAPAADAAASA